MKKSRTYLIKTNKRELTVDNSKWNINILVDRLKAMGEKIIKVEEIKND